MPIGPKKIPAAFYQSANGVEPVRSWLKRLAVEDRRVIGKDIMIVEYGWPVGMPVCRSITAYKGLWEVRSQLGDSRIARVLFCIVNGQMVLLHGFIKKSQKTPKGELELAAKRKKEIENVR